MGGIVLPPGSHDDCGEPGYHWHKTGDGRARLHRRIGGVCTDPWPEDNTLGCVSARVPPTPPKPGLTEVVDEAVAQRLWDVLDASDCPFDDSPDGARSYWLDKAQQVIAGLEGDGYTIAPKSRETERWAATIRGVG